MENEKETKKTIKEKFKERVEKTKTFIKEHTVIEAATPFVIGGIGVILGAVGHAIADNAINGNKQIAWDDYYDVPDHEEAMTHTVTPTIKDIKKGKIDSKRTYISFDKSDMDEERKRLNWDVKFRDEE